LTGDVRIRDMMITPASTSNEFVTVDMATGILEHRPLPTLTSCDWIIQTPDPHVSNVYDGTSCDWDMRHGVGIGYDFPRTKLHVYHTENELLDPTAIFADAHFDLEVNEVTGVFGRAQPTVVWQGEIFPTAATGVRGVAHNYNYTIGVDGLASTDEAAGGIAEDVIGVRGIGRANENANRVIGVFGEASGAQGGNNWAGYFDGRVNIVGDLWHGTNQIWSDANLKEDLDYNGSLSSGLHQLIPRRYTFTSEAQSRLNLPSGEQFGLFAQELQDVYPQLVSSMIIPAQLDSLGNEVGPEMELMGVNYIGLIPLLIDGYQEQQAVVEELSALLAEQETTNAEILSRMDQLEQLLALCCQAPPSDTDHRNLLEEGNGLFNNPADERFLRIQPNPFNEQTTIHYNLERGGRMQLMANSSDGKQLRVLEDAQMPAGEYQYAWYTADLSAGIYYVTLLLDGEPVVKKAVKVN
jgi:hypothetical protein